MHEYATEELRRRIFDPGDRFYLIDTLPEPSYRNRHIPGAISLPLEELEPRRIFELLPDRELEVITYCSGPG